MAKFWHAEARKMRWSGKTLKEIGIVFNVTDVAVYHVVKDIPKIARPARTKVPAVTLAISEVRTKGRPKIEIPAWVIKAELGGEYRELANSQDEHAAASHCRALLREMRAST